MASRVMATLGGGLDLAVLRDLATLEANRTLLQSCGWVGYDAQLDVFLANLRSRGGRVQPYAMVLCRDGEAVGAAMARIEDVELGVKLGHRLRYSPTLRTLFVVHGGVAGVDDPHVASRLAGAVHDVLVSREARAAFVPNLVVGSQFERALAEWPATRRGWYEYRRVRRTAGVADDFDTFLARRSRKTRQSIRYYRRRLHERVPGADIRRFRDPWQLEELTLALEQVAGRSWQRGLGGGFTPTRGELETYRVAMAQDALLAWVLYDGRQPVAFRVGWHYDRRFTLRFTAYDPAYADARPGLLLLAAAIEDLCADPRVDMLDFGGGDAPLKRSFADDAVLETDSVLFGPGVRTATVNLMRSGANAAGAAARAAFERFPALDDARRRRRRRIGRDHLE